MESTKYAIFKQGNVECGLDVIDIQAIEKVVPMETVAASTKNIKGIINLRNNRLPVYSLRRKFGLEDKEPDENSRFLVVLSNGIPMAYEVDEMMNIVQLNTEQLYEVPEIVKNDNTSYLNSVASIDGRIVLVINPNNILSEEEKKELKALIS